ncbi:MAG TPA: MBL fold metallo-hydrolase [Pseudonocardiaceae bacterium]|nr:MBL fold metallo-hydrolase [Pseudonocardiaceae bacterium]
MIRRLLAPLVGMAAAGWVLRDVRAALGGKPDIARMRRSPQFRDGTFRNPEPTRTLPPGSGKDTLRDMVLGKQQRHPRGPVPLVGKVDGSTDGLHITWYGHASTLVEIDGAAVLLDPVWSDRCSPSSLIGPRRMHPPPHSLDEIPPLTAIVISHDHYDHLDMATVRTLTRTQSAPFVVPLGIGAHLERWDVPADRIVELGWDESHEVGGLTLTATAAQHFSGRAFTRDNTLWASWVIAGGGRRVFYTGDTGYFAGYTRIGERHGPFDVSLVQIGAYGEGWPDIHMTPEEGVQAHLDVQGGLLVPVHWATFNLALHDWSEPVDRVWREAKERDVPLAVPRPGERIDVDDPPGVDGWWQTLA